jgi:hypothetical protein
VDVERLALGVRGMALDRHLGLDVPAAEGDAVGGAGLLHPGQRPEPLHQLGVEEDPLLRAGILGVRRRDPEGEDTLGVEPDVGMGIGPVALEQESGADHQHQRQGDLGDHQNAAKPGPARALAGAAGAFAQRAGQVDVGVPERRHQPEQDAGQGGEAEGDGQRGAVEASGMYQGIPLGIASPKSRIPTTARPSPSTRRGPRGPGSR